MQEARAAVRTEGAPEEDPRPAQVDDEQQPGRVGHSEEAYVRERAASDLAPRSARSDGEHRAISKALAWPEMLERDELFVRKGRLSDARIGGHVQAVQDDRSAS